MGKFVIQDHKAKRAGHHWDLRLEWDGDLEKYQSMRNFSTTTEPEGEPARSVMRSWAIPKHRLPDHGEQLLAMPTEDHPMSYNHFVEPGEMRMIPPGYGHGEVRLVARGEYDLVKVSDRGSITFVLGSEVEYCWDGVNLGKFYLIPFNNKFLIRRG